GPDYPRQRRIGATIAFTLISRMGLLLDDAKRRDTRGAGREGIRGQLGGTRVSVLTVGAPPRASVISVCSWGGGGRRVGPSRVCRCLRRVPSRSRSSDR